MAKGRCNCASITVSIPELPKQCVICYWYGLYDRDHCYMITKGYSANCRRAGSTPGSLIYVINKREVSFIDPDNHLTSYEDGDTISGNHIIRQFCGKCGCPIASLVSEDAPQLYLKAGLFDTLPPPGFKAFQENEPKWLKIDH